jgi:hypothetical protein
MEKAKNVEPWLLQATSVNWKEQVQAARYQTPVRSIPLQAVLPLPSENLFVLSFPALYTKNWFWISQKTPNSSEKCFPLSILSISVLKTQRARMESEEVWHSQQVSNDNQEPEQVEWLQGDWGTERTCDERLHFVCTKDDCTNYLKTQTEIERPFQSCEHSIFFYQHCSMEDIIVNYIAMHFVIIVSIDFRAILVSTAERRRMDVDFSFKTTVQHGATPVTRSGGGSVWSSYRYGKHGPQSSRGGSLPVPVPGTVVQNDSLMEASDTTVILFETRARCIMWVVVLLELHQGHHQLHSVHFFQYS